MKIVIFRHAEKVAHSADGNPSLTHHGLRQAEQILQLAQERNLPKPQKVLTSPKLRTQQTLEPLAKWAQVQSEVDALLNERQFNETAAEFRSRCLKAIAKIETLATLNCVYACSHFDWVEEVIDLVPTDESTWQNRIPSWESAQHVEFEFNNGLWKFIRLGRVKI